MPYSKPGVKGKLEPEPVEGTTVGRPRFVAVDVDASGKIVGEPTPLPQADHPAAGGSLVAPLDLSGYTGPDPISPEVTRPSLRATWPAGEIIDDLDLLVQRAHIQSVRSGFWEDKAKNDPLIKLALIASEVGEAVDAFRKPAMSDHIPHFTNREEELADIIIRVFDMAAEYAPRLGEAVINKMAFNAQRSYKHGGRQY